MPTIGIDFKIKYISVKSKTVKLQLWDTAGQERFRNITQTYYKGAAGIVLAYDCTDRRSFNDISNWMRQIDNHAHKDIVRVIVANKIDCIDKEVTQEEGEELAKDYGCMFIQTSAKTGENIEELFYKTAEILCKTKLDSKDVDITESVDLRKSRVDDLEHSRRRKKRWCKWFTK